MLLRFSIFSFISLAICQQRSQQQNGYQPQYSQMNQQQFPQQRIQQNPQQSYQPPQELQQPAHYQYFNMPKLNYPTLPWNQETPEVPQQEDVCHLRKNWTRQMNCDYVTLNKGNCEGGGYLQWTNYVECVNTKAQRIIIIIAGVLYMLFMFLMVSTVADNFFSPNVAAIVAHLKISESVAGVTFMAFGNGAPDIFGSIASILSTPNPKAGLSLGLLMGGGIFITTIVVATIILTQPFKADAFSILRDLIFYLVAVGFILFVFLYDTQIYLFEPLVFLLLYVVYIATVIGKQLVHRRRQRLKKKRLARIESQMTDVTTVTEESHAATRLANQLISLAQSVTPSVFTISGGETEKEKDKDLISTLSQVTFDSELGSNSETSEANEEGEISEAEDVVVVHNHVYIRDEKHPINLTKTSLLKRHINGWRTCVTDLFEHLNPIPSRESWQEMNYFERVFEIANIIPTFIFKASVPLDEYKWSKAVACMLALTCPQFILFALQKLTLSPFHGSPGLWLYALGVSLIIIILISIFTRFDTEPRWYKEIYAYVGFVVAVIWIYFLATEIISVVTMIGVVSKISYEVLGMSILAWSNCIGDIIADRAVAKQGFSRMAIAAAIGGPLFNFLMGFGIPFLIAKARGTTISLEFTPACHFAVLFLGIALVTTLVASIAQRFYLRRPHGVVLIVIYVTFMVMIILTETRVIVWD